MKALLVLMLVLVSSIVRGQDLSYDFTKGRLSLEQWNSITGYIQSRNYDIPNSDSLTSDGLILAGKKETPTFLEIVTGINILPGWRGDILEEHEPNSVKFSRSKIKLVLRGAGGKEIASKTAEVSALEPGSATLHNVECTDPEGCYIQVVLWNHDTIDNPALNKLKKIELRSYAHQTKLDFEENLNLLETAFGTLQLTNLKRRIGDEIELRGRPGYETAVEWTSARLFSFGWRGSIIEEHEAENIYWAGNIHMFLKGISDNRTQAQAESFSGGKPLAQAHIENAECNDPFGCYLEVELACPEDYGEIVRNRLKSITIHTNREADEFEVGVFYMPFWHNVSGIPYWNSDVTEHHWFIVDRYNTAMDSAALTSHVKKPLNLYATPLSPPSYYNEEDVRVNLKQLSMMREYGIDYVIYDSYFQYYKQNIADTLYNPEKWAPFWDSVVKNVSQLSTPPIPFSIMWANDFTAMVYDPANPMSKANPRGCRGFFEADGGLDRLLSHWDSLLANPNYKRINGKPVVYIYYSGTADPAFGGHTNSLEGLCGYCGDDPFFDPMGPDRYEADLSAKKTAFFLSKIKEKLGKDIFFVAVVSSALAWQDPFQKYDWYLDYPIKGGFDAVTSYGLSAFDCSDLFMDATWWKWDWSYDYERMIGAYSKYYSFLLDQNYSALTSGNLKFHLPVTAGFNRGPLNLHENRGDATNGYAVNIWDQAVSTPETFLTALSQAKNALQNYPNQTGRNVTICCWNEYAEGTVIEPTTTWRYAYLEKVKELFVTGEVILPSNKEIVEQSTTDVESGRDFYEEETGPVETLVPVPTKNKLHGHLKIFPNPLERSASITFDVVSKTQASVRILNLQGLVVDELLDQTVDSGNHEVTWNAERFPAGFYYCKIVTNDYVEVKKVILTH